MADRIWWPPCCTERPTTIYQMDTPLFFKKRRPFRFKVRLSSRGSNLFFFEQLDSWTALFFIDLSDLWAHNHVECDRFRFISLVKKRETRAKLPKMRNRKSAAAVVVYYFLLLLYSWSSWRLKKNLDGFLLVFKSVLAVHAGPKKIGGLCARCGESCRRLLPNECLHNLGGPWAGHRDRTGGASRHWPNQKKNI